MKLQIVLFILSFVFLSACAGKYAPMHAQKEPGSAVSVLHPVEYEKNSTKEVTVFNFVGNPGMVGTEAVFKLYEVSERNFVPVVEGTWKPMVRKNNGNIVYGEAFIAYVVGKNPLNRQCNYQMMAIFAGVLEENEKILMSSRDGGMLYTLSGKSIEYDPRKFDDDAEYKAMHFDKVGMGLHDLAMFMRSVDMRSNITRIKVGSNSWNAFRQEFDRIMKSPAIKRPMIINNQVRSTRLSEQDFRETAVSEPGFDATGRFIKKGALSLTGIGASFLGAGPAGAAIAASAGDIASANINTGWTGLYSQSLEERGKMASGSDNMAYWCSQQNQAYARR
ncbi:hypothetical protein ISS03_03775 [Patescibacteria group bacterium]|nr:hypothetical protein [Patescibacteria group bacterium]